MHIVPEFGIGPDIVQGGITEGVLVRKLLCDTVQYLRKGKIDQDIVLPYVFSGPGGVVIQRTVLDGFRFHIMAHYHSPHF